MAAAAVDSGALAPLLMATRDADPRVRQVAATEVAEAMERLRGRERLVDPDGRTEGVLSDAARDAVLARLRELVATDSSRHVRGAALVSLAAVAPDAALQLMDLVLSRDSWLDTERSAAMSALGRINTTASWQRTLPFLGAGTRRETRLAAINSLLARADGREGDLANELVPLLNSDDLFIRTAAAAGLGRLGQRSAIPALEARQAIEAESRVINAILGALAALRSRS
jgi:HEAT repeat protein